MCMADIILQFSWEKLQSRQGALEGWVCFLHGWKVRIESQRGNGEGQHNRPS